MFNAPTSVEEAVARRERSLKLLTFNRTDAGNAEAFALLYGHAWRYDYSLGIWRQFNTRFWEADDRGAADRAALETARQRFEAAKLIEDADEKKKAIMWALHSESSYGRKAMLASAESITALATTAADYDRDRFLLAVGNGTLNLGSGELRESRPEDLITRATSVPYLPNAECLRWTRFLNEIFLNDAEVISFVQRAVGYSLTGDVREHCLFLLWGGGANGKSTFLEIVLELLGTLAAISPFSTFSIGHSAGAPRNDLARLHGVRLVKAAESQRQAELDEAFVKEVTGNDKLVARYLFMEYFEFHPQFKLWVASNYLPVIRGTDQAIWRRIRLIPFPAQFTGKNRDSQLREKLEAELPGILAWAVRGCLEWQRAGLGMAPVVERATLNYRQESDHFGRFLGECCTTDPGNQVGGKELFEAYVEWCGQKGEKPESTNTFAKTLAERGMGKKRSSKGIVYMGVGLRPRTRPAETTNTPSKRNKAAQKRTS